MKYFNKEDLLITIRILWIVTVQDRYKTNPTNAVRPLRSLIFQMS